MQQILIRGKDGKKKLVNVPGYNIGINEVGWDSGGGYNDYAYYLGPIMYLDAGRNDSYYSGSLYQNTGTNWYNVSGKNYNGTLNNGVTYSSNNGGILNYDGVNDFVSVNDLGSLANWSAVTWVKFDTLNANPTVPAIITNRFGAGDTKLNFVIGFGLTAYSQTIKAGIFNAGWATTTGYTVVTNRWYNFTATYDGSALKLYVDGVLFNSTATSIVAATSTRGVAIGKRWDADDCIDGSIPVAIMYNKAISASDVTLLYNQFAPRYV